jgi:hypothetical protein
MKNYQEVYYQISTITNTQPSSSSSSSAAAAEVGRIRIRR